MMRAGFRQVTAVLISAGVLLAMGGTAFAEALSIDPCNLLTREEVESVMGQKLKRAPVPGRGEPDNYQSKELIFCKYEFDKPGKSFLLEVASFDLLSMSHKLSKTAVMVNGLGDEALMDQREVAYGFFVQLVIRKGNGPIKSVPGVRLTTIDTAAAAEEQLKMLGKKAVGRM